MTKEIICRDIKIGNGNPISIQSMTNTKTSNVKATLEQIRQLHEEGCQIIRVAINTMEAAEALTEIRKKVDLPLVGDVHFDYRLAIAAIKNGVDKIRINPGNIGSEEKVKAVVEAAKERKVPIRVGINGGSLEKDILSKFGGVSPEALTESAIRNINLIEKYNYDQIVVSVKSSNVLTNVKAYRLLSKKTDYPLHIGLTEAGYSTSGIIKSSVALGGLILDGIGDTMRVSLTGNPVEEIKIAKEILYATGSRKALIEVISCPTCGRTHGDLEKYVKLIYKKIEEQNLIEQIIEPISVAVMGCEVNGPGEAKEATYGVAYGKDVALVFQKGKVVSKVKEEEGIQTLIDTITKSV